MRIWKPNVTVAAVVERDGRFLVVEEETEDGLRFNQPAGHLEEDEPLVDAVVREALEETAYHFKPTHLVGIYNWKHPAKDVTYLRFAFAGELRGWEADRKLDEGIVGARWLTLRVEVPALASMDGGEVIPPEETADPVIQAVKTALANKWLREPETGEALVSNLFLGTIEYEQVESPDGGIDPDELLVCLSFRCQYQDD